MTHVTISTGMGVQIKSEMLKEVIVPCWTITCDIVEKVAFCETQCVAFRYLEMEEGGHSRRNQGTKSQSQV